MNSRERVMAAINHRIPDRVPVDFWWSREIKDKLLAHLKLNDQDELQDFLGSDVRCVYPVYRGPPLRRFEDGSYEDWWGVVRRPSRHTSSEYDELVHAPLAQAETWRDVENSRWPDPDWFDYDGLTRQIAPYKGRAVMVGRMGIETQSIFVQTWSLRGWHKALLDLAANPDLMKAMIERIMAFRLEHVSRILKAAGGRIDLLQIADDYASHQGLMLSPDVWRTFFAPHIRALSKTAHDAGVKVFFHCCGSCRKIIPDLIEMGVDVLNPVEPQAAGMDPFALKAEFGGRLAFHGGIVMETYPPGGGPEAILAQVRERIRVLAPGGGYVMAPVTAIEANVPLENILALYKAARDCP